MHKEYGLVYTISGVLDPKVWEHLRSYERRFDNKLTVYVEHENACIDDALRGMWDKYPQWSGRGTDCFATAAECIDVVKNNRVSMQSTQEKPFTPVHVYYDYHFTRTTDEIVVSRIQYTCKKECDVDYERVQEGDVIYEYTLPECAYPIRFLYVDCINGDGCREPRIIRPPRSEMQNADYWKQEPAQCMPMEHIVETQYDSVNGEWLQIRNSYWDPDIREYFYDRMLGPQEDY